MTIREVRTLYDARPFRPLVFIPPMDGGFVLLTTNSWEPPPTARTAIVYQAYGSFGIVVLLLVSALQGRPNGTARKKRRA